MSALQHRTLAGDKQSIVLSSALQGQQALAIFALPLLALRLRRPLSLTRVTREYSLSSLVAGPAVGAAYALARVQTMPEDEVTAWATERSADRGLKRREDYGVIGGWVGALALPAVFLRRAPVLALLTAGYSLGTASGVLWHYAAGGALASPGIADPPVSGVGKGALGGV